MAAVMICCARCGIGADVDTTIRTRCTGELVCDECFDPNEPLMPPEIIPSCACGHRPFMHRADRGRCNAVGCSCTTFSDGT
jgi:hypothetical protein